MGAAAGLAHHLVHQPQALQAPGGQAQLFGRILGLAGVLPQDRGAALGGDDRVGAVFEHDRAVAHADGQRAAGAALADHGADDRHLQLGHFDQVAGDGFGLAAFLGIDARPGAGGVDQGEDRQAEALGHLHQAQCLAVALRLGHAEVAHDLFLGGAAFLVADDHHRAAVDPAQAADDGLVVGEGAVAGQFLELFAEHLDVIGGVGTGRMARKLRDLPGREIAEDLGGAHAQLVLQGAHFGIDIDRRAGAGVAQFLDLGFQVGDGLFEIEVIGSHRQARGRKAGSLAQAGARPRERAVRRRNGRHGFNASRGAGPWPSSPRARRAARAGCRPARHPRAPTGCR